MGTPLRETGALPETDVLVVEDEQAVRSVICSVLTEAGYSVAAVEDGLAALAAVQEGRYRAIVCDLRMPSVDGVRFYEYLQSGFPALANSVLFLTAAAREPGAAEFLRRSGRPVLEKPYELKALVEAVAHLVDRPPSPGVLL